MQILVRRGIHALRTGERRAVERQRWTELFPRVYWPSLSEPGLLDWGAAARAWAGDGAVLSHETAAYLHGMPGYWRPLPLGLTVPRSKGLRRYGSEVLTRRLLATANVVTVDKRRRLVREVELTRADLGPEDLVAIDGLLCTSVERTLVDIAEYLPRWDLAFVFEWAWRADLTLRDRLEERLRKSQTAYRGSHALRAIVKDSHQRDRPMRSALEMFHWQFVIENRLPIPEVDVELRDEEGVMYADFAYLDRDVVVELVGLEWHGGRKAFDRDARRTERLMALGLSMFPITFTECMFHRESLLARYRQMLKRFPPRRLRRAKS